MTAFVVLNGNCAVIPTVEAYGRLISTSVDTTVTCAVHALSVSQQLRFERFRGFSISHRVNKDIWTRKERRNPEKQAKLYSVIQSSWSGNGHSSVFQYERTASRHQQRFRGNYAAFSKHGMLVCTSSGCRALHSCHSCLGKTVPSRSRLPSRPTSKPARPNYFSKYDEHILEGVKERDRRRDIEAIKQDLQGSKLDHDRMQCLTQFKHLSDDIQQTEESIPEAMKTARREGRLDYRLSFHNEVHDGVAKIRHEAVYIREIVWLIDESRRERKIQALEEELEDFESNMSDVDAEFLKVRMVDGADVALAQGANALVAAIQQFKIVERKQLTLWKKINRLENTIVDILQLISRLRKTTPAFDSLTLDTLNRATDTSLEITDPYNSTTDNPQATWIGNYAHRVREIELSMRMAKHRPEITFSRRWSTATIARYTWPLLDDSEEFRIFLCRSAFASYLHDDREQWSPVQRSRGRRIRLLEQHLQRYSAQLKKICEIFSGMIGEGYNSLCPHPSAKLHHLQSQAFRPIEKNDEGWAQLTSVAKVASGMIERMCRIGNESKARLNALKSLDLIVKPPQNISHPLSRRGNYHVRDEILVWHSTRLLMETPASASEVTVSEFRKPATNFVESPPNTYLSRTKQVRDVAPSVQWLVNNSLYPRGMPIPISLVRTHPTLHQAVASLSTQSVIGVDALCSYTHPLDPAVLQYVVMATTNNVYIFDVWELKRLSGVLCKWAMQLVLERDSILKVGMDAELISKILWDTSSISLATTYDLSRNLLPGQVAGVDATISLLGRHFHLRPDIDVSTNLLPEFRETDPGRFFYVLAIRAYAPLKLFNHLYQHRTVVESDHRMSFDLNDHHDMLRDCDTSNAELGPVIIDRRKQAFHSDYVEIPASRRLAFSGASRKVWMQNLSLAMARQYLGNSKKITSQSPSRMVESFRQSREVAISIYYLATVFGEHIHDIEENLGVPEAAKYVLWAAQYTGLTLNSQDKEKYQDATGLSSAKLEALYKQDNLPIPLIVRSRLHQTSKYTTRFPGTMRLRVSDQELGNIAQSKHDPLQPGLGNGLEGIKTIKLNEDVEDKIEWSPWTARYTQRGERATWNRKLDMGVFQADDETLGYDTPSQEPAEQLSQTFEAAHLSGDVIPQSTHEPAASNRAEHEPAEAEVTETFTRVSIRHASDAREKTFAIHRAQRLDAKVRVNDKAAILRRALTSKRPSKPQPSFGPKQG